MNAFLHRGGALVLGPCSGNRKDGGAYSVTPVSPSKSLFPGTATRFNPRVAQEGNEVTDPSENELATHGWVEGVAEGFSKA